MSEQKIYQTKWTNKLKLNKKKGNYISTLEEDNSEKSKVLLITNKKINEQITKNTNKPLYHISIIASLELPYFF